jgi:hypothetical protein
MPDGSNPRTDIGVSLLVIVICAAVLWQAAKLPPGSFEPLGSAPVPQATAGVIVLLCLWVIARAGLALQRGEVRDGADGTAPRLLDATAVFFLTVVYVLTMAFRLGEFAIVTSIFLFVTIGLLIRFEPRRLPIAAVVAVIMGYGCRYVFTQIFVVDLPAG